MMSTSISKMSRNIINNIVQGVTYLSHSAKDLEVGIWIFCQFRLKGLYGFSLDAMKEKYHKYVIGLADTFRFCTYSDWDSIDINIYSLGHSLEGVSEMLSEIDFSLLLLDSWPL